MDLAGAAPPHLELSITIEHLPSAAKTYSRSVATRHVPTIDEFRASVGRRFVADDVEDDEEEEEEDDTSPAPVVTAPVVREPIVLSAVD